MSRSVTRSVDVVTDDLLLSLSAAVAAPYSSRCGTVAGRAAAGDRVILSTGRDGDVSTGEHARTGRGAATATTTVSHVLCFPDNRKYLDDDAACRATDYLSRDSRATAATYTGGDENHHNTPRFRTTTRMFMWRTERIKKSDEKKKIRRAHYDDTNDHGEDAGI